VKPLFAFAVVGIGGALGSMLRYAITILSVERIGPGFPWHTAAINILGSFLIGIVATYSQSSIGLSPYVSAFAMVGVLGGFTTFSTFSYDTVTLLSDGVPTIALAYACGSVIVGVLGAMAGMALARIVLHAT
jgi:CrcB protein